MRLDERPGDVEPESCSVTAGRAAPELRENPGRTRLGHTLALVRHGHLGPGRRAAHDDGDGTRTVAQRVVDKIVQHLFDLVGVQPHLRQFTVSEHREPVMSGLPGRDLAVHDPAQRQIEIHDLLAHLDPTGIDARHIEHLGEQSGDPVRIGVDGVEHELLLLFGEPVPLRQQRGREPLHARQR